MPTPKDPVRPDEAKTPGKRTEDQDLQLWAHFADVGRTDKTTMVSVSSLLLGFSASIAGYIVTQLFPTDCWRLNQPGKAICLAFLGIVVSGVAWYVVILYGGYSNWNWAKADEIALRHKWRDLVRNPNGAPSERQGPGKVKASYQAGTAKEYSEYLARKAKEYSEPHDHQKELAPVFVAFARLSSLAVFTHLILLIWSAVSLVCSLRK